VPAINPKSGSSGRRRGPSAFARRPEILPVAATALAWVLLAAVTPATAWVGLAEAPAGAVGDAGEHAVHGGALTPAGIAMLAVMTLAMMGLPAIAGVRTVAFTSLWWRAGRASGWFLAAYMLTWTVIAVCLQPVAETAAGVLGSPAIAAGVLVLLTALSQLDPRRADRMTACDRPMRLRSNGSDAYVDCARFGLLTAARSAPLCALPMLAMLALPGSLLMTALLTTLSVADRVTQGHRRPLFAVCYLLVAALLLL
jgi:hypothetical protein